ncbi:MAG: serine dehydratase subunit alpha family protein [Dysgonomonas sp.]
MIEKKERSNIIDLIKKEVVPAIGCTEPIAVALCVSKATETLGRIPDKISVLLSPNILKNAMGVGIPGTGGMIGLPIAIALGALVGKSKYLLQVLKDCKPDDVEKGKQMIANNTISISLKENNTEMLYIEAICDSENDTATCIISGQHTNFSYIARNGTIILNKKDQIADSDFMDNLILSMQKVYEFATETPINEIRFILESGRLNLVAARQSLTEIHGHSLGRTLCSETERKTMGDSTFSHMLSYTSAACDARMAGAMIPVMSNSGSGNQGIAATLPVVIYAGESNKSEEKLTRALALSNLTVIYIKQYLGRLSALCGCVVAATGSSCGITYLMGGSYEQITYAVKNMVANLTGMICDGAKPSCALKVSSGVSTAMFSAMMAMEGKCVTSVEGIVDDDVDKTIQNLAKIGKEGMCETDKLVLSIMTNK